MPRRAKPLDSDESIVDDRDNRVDDGPEEMMSEPQEITKEMLSDQMDGDAAEVAVAAVDELAEQGVEIDMLKTELEQTRDQLVRQAAEFQNYRRRTEQEKSTMISFGQIVVIEQLLDLADDFQRTLEAAAETATTESMDSLKNGVELVYQKLREIFTRHGVEPIETEGQRFDENLHEALMQQPAPEGVEAGTILSEIQRGYRIGDRILRHARVVVASESQE